MTSIDIVLCNECDNLMRSSKVIDGVKYLVCPACGALKNLPGKDVEEPGDAASSQKKYDFANKQASRLVIKRLLETCRAEELTKSHDQQKVLILTHVEGHDLKEILLPLGYKKENILVVEREKDVFEKITKNPFFDGCQSINMDLEHFDRSTKFDLLYLDFKSNISPAIMETIARLLAFNTRDGTAVYINVQMARETREITDKYKKMHEAWIDGLERKVKKKKIDRRVGNLMGVFFKTMKIFRSIVLGMKNGTVDVDFFRREFSNDTWYPMIQSIMRSLVSGKDMKYTIKSDSGEIVIYLSPSQTHLITFDLEGEKLVLDTDEPTERFIEKFQAFKNRFIDEARMKNEIEESETWHLLRQKIIEQCVKRTLNAFIDHTDTFSKHFGKELSLVDVPLEMFEMNEMNDREKNMAGIIRYLSRSLVPVRFSQFMYKSNNYARTPFLNTFFVLKEYPSLLDAAGYDDLATFLGDAMIIFWLHSKGKIPKRSCTISLQNYLFMEKTCNGEGLTREQAIDFDRISQNEVRHMFNETRNIYSDLVSNNLLRVKENGEIDLKMARSNWSTVTYHGNMKKYVRLARSGALKRKDSTVDFSATILKVYLTSNLLRRMETEIEKAYMIKGCEIIDVDEEEGVETAVEDAIPTIIDPIEPVIQVARAFKKEMNEILKRSKKLNDTFLSIGEFLQSKGIDPKECTQEYLLIKLAILSLFDVDKLKKKRARQLPGDKLARIIREFVKKQGNVVASDLAVKINAHVKKKYGYDPGVKTQTVSAHKYWHRARSGSPDLA